MLIPALHRRDLTLKCRNFRLRYGPGVRSQRRILPGNRLPGLVNSLNRPGANITGLTPAGVEVGGKRLQLLSDLAPGIKVIAVLLNPDTPFSTLALQELRPGAEARGQRLELCEVRTADQLSTSVAAAARAGATGLMVSHPHGHIGGEA